MKLLTIAIAIFGLGFIANELLQIPALLVAAACFAIIIGLLSYEKRKTR
jgi:hypothetical protein